MGVIFISHSSRDNDEASRLRDWLINTGGWPPSQIFIDLTEFASGDRWRERLNYVGHHCEAVIVCLSDNWIQSAECLREFNHAESAGKPIYPVLVKPLTEPLPNFVAAVQFADISHPSTSDDGLEKLRLGLTRANIDPKHFRWPPEDEPDRLPYRGLHALEQQDAAIFFGRDAQIAAGLDKLRQIRNGSPKRILTIAAASGAGKSSFLRAGLLARLERDTENFLVLPVMRPGRDAMFGETGVLATLTVDRNGLSSANIVSRTLDQLQSRQAELVNRLNQLASSANERYTAPPPIIILPVDQAEEIFSADNNTGKSAINLLLHCLGQRNDFALVATIRSDSLGQLQANAAVAEHIEPFSLPALPPAAFKDVIEGPASLAKPPIKIEPALTQKLIADLNTSDSLPLLAFTMERLSEKYAADNTLKLAEYEQGLGGVSGAINAAVESAMERAAKDPHLSNERRALDRLARLAFLPWLVQLDEADASPKRRISKLSDLPVNTHLLVEHLVEERLLVRSELNGATQVEVSHEAIFRHWRGLSVWISEERFTLERLHRVQRASHEWHDGGKAEDLLVHRGDPLEQANALLIRDDLARLMGAEGQAYLDACSDHVEAISRREQAQKEQKERAERDAQKAELKAANEREAAETQRAEAARRIAYRTRQGLMASLFLSVLAVGAGGWAWHKGEEAEANKTRAVEEAAHANEQRRRTISNVLEGPTQFELPSLATKLSILSSAIVRIEKYNQEGSFEPLGSGFLISAKTLNPKWPDEVLIVTANHVVGSYDNGVSTKPNEVRVCPVNNTDMGCYENLRIIFQDGIYDRDITILAHDSPLIDERKTSSNKPSIDIIENERLDEYKANAGIDMSSNPNWVGLYRNKGNNYINAVFVQVLKYEVKPKGSGPPITEFHTQHVSNRGASGSPLFDAVNFSLVCMHHGLGIVNIEDLNAEAGKCIWLGDLPDIVSDIDFN